MTTTFATPTELLATKATALRDLSKKTGEATSYEVKTFRETIGIPLFDQTNSAKVGQFLHKFKIDPTKTAFTDQEKSQILQNFQLFLAGGVATQAVSSILCKNPLAGIVSTLEDFAETIEQAAQAAINSLNLADLVDTVTETANALLNSLAAGVEGLLGTIGGGLTAIAQSAVSMVDNMAIWFTNTIESIYESFTADMRGLGLRDLKVMEILSRRFEDIKESLKSLVSEENLLLLKAAILSRIRRFSETFVDLTDAVENLITCSTKDMLADVETSLDTKVQKFREDSEITVASIEDITAVSQNVLAEPAAAGRPVPQRAAINCEDYTPPHSGGTTSDSGASVPPLSSEEITNRERIAMDYFTSIGYTPEQAAGIVGNLWAESRLQTAAVNKGDGRDGSNSIGIAQWNSGRAVALKRFGGPNWTSYEVQLQFVAHELNTSESKAGRNLKAASSVSEASNAMAGYERFYGWNTPAGAANRAKRIAKAKQVYNSYVGSSGV